LITALIAGTDETYEHVREGDGLAALDQPVLDWKPVTMTKWQPQERTY